MYAFKGRRNGYWVTGLEGLAVRFSAANSARMAFPQESPSSSGAALDREKSRVFAMAEKRVLRTNDCCMWCVGVERVPTLGVPEKPSTSMAMPSVYGEKVSNVGQGASGTVKPYRLFDCLRVHRAMCNEKQFTYNPQGCKGYMEWCSVPKFTQASIGTARQERDAAKKLRQRSQLYEHVV